MPLLLLLLGIGAGVMVVQRQRAEAALADAEKTARDAEARLQALRASALDSGQSVEAAGGGLKLVRDLQASSKDLSTEQTGELSAVTTESAISPTSYSAVDASSIRRMRGARIGARIGARTSARGF